MKQGVLAACLLLLFVLIVYYFNAQKNEVALATTNLSQASLLLSSTAIQPSLILLAQQEKMQIDSYLSQLKNVPLRQLKTSLHDFWQRCRQLQRCDAWLLILQAELDENRYQLFAAYPSKQQQLELSMGQDFSSYDDLSHNIEVLKQKHQDAFGDISTELFAQEYALYHYKESVDSIHLAHQDSLLADKVEALDQLHEQLMAQSDPSDYSPVFLSEQARYQQALAFIDTEQSADEVFQQKSYLAEHYLSDEQAKAIIQRQQQMLNQEHQRQQYQQDFIEFQQQLNVQRQTSSSSMSESEWQDYQQQKIFDFRRDYFNKK